MTTYDEARRVRDEAAELVRRAIPGDAVLSAGIGKRGGQYIVVVGVRPDAVPLVPTDLTVGGVSVVVEPADRVVFACAVMPAPRNGQE